MAEDLTISQLPAAEKLEDGDLMVMESATGVAHHLTVAQLRQAVTPTETLALVRQLLGKAVYTEDVTADLAALDALLGGGELPDEPVVPPDEPEVVTETLTPVFATGYPDRTTFEYTEGSGSAVDNYWGYVVFKRSNVRGGELQIDLDITRWTGYKTIVYVFDSTGAPYLHLSQSGTDFITDPIITANQHVYINEIGSTAGGWIHVNLPSVTYQVPAGCSVMVCITGVAGTSTEILDESLIMDTPTGKRYKLFNAIVAGEVLTAKVVGGVSNG